MDKAPAILAFTVPAAGVLISIAWAITTYLIVCEKQRTQVELARLAAANSQNTSE